MNEELKKGSSIFFIELEKIEPNPYQPRIEFNQSKLEALSDSIKQYGVLQPIVVSRKEEFSEEFGIRTKYQIIAGERRFRASKLAGLKQIPAIIREGEQTDSEKLELAIIENLQREDLNPVDKAKAFKKLADNFNLTHAEIAKKMGKSREYVSNAMRILMLPENMLLGLTAGKLTEGHTRSLLMLKDRPEEQSELYKRVINDKLTVRAAEKIARSVAVDKIRKRVDVDPEIKQIEDHIREKLGTRVTVDQKPIGEGGRLMIDFYSKDDLRKILEIIESNDSDISVNTLVNENEDEINQSTDNFNDIQPMVFKEEIDNMNQFRIPQEQLDDNSTEDISLKTDIISPVAEVSENIIQDKIDGLEKIEIKNDFDKSRVEAFGKTDEILKSFGASIENKDNTSDVVDTEIREQKDIALNNIPEDLLVSKTEDKPSEDESYSDLYAEFLKSKDDIHSSTEENSIDETAYIKPEKEEEENNIEDNFLINSDNFTPPSIEEGIKVSSINSVGTGDFLADVKSEENDEQNDKNNDEKSEEDKKEDDLYNFRGFSL